MFQMTAPRVKVMRLEMMLTSIDDCGVIAADVGPTALASVKEVWRRAMRARCGCFDVVVSRMNRRSEAGGTAGCARNSVEGKQLVGEGGKV